MPSPMANCAFETLWHGITMLHYCKLYSHCMSHVVWCHMFSYTYCCWARLGHMAIDPYVWLCNWTQISACTTLSGSHYCCINQATPRPVTVAAFTWSTGYDSHAYGRAAYGRAAKHWLKLGSKLPTYYYWWNPGLMVQWAFTAASSGYIDMHHFQARGQSPLQSTTVQGQVYAMLPRWKVPNCNSLPH